ncbi:hypothetical protein ANCDUO_11897 [Ancylostoma duodenale]|uniref:Uncharacterized protein n=1 Tax=Ancylostoma duodenale TaxID=51022 RepID=A0A0C2CMR4_9BILA|nr:hypothetical protein ANCDUO_11897 [Ancylostoma duodenale]
MDAKPSKVSAEVDAKLKSYTPFENGRYMVDKSTPEQTVQQHRILTRAAADLGVVQAECDQAGRNKFVVTSLECFVRFIINRNYLEDAIPLCHLIVVMAAYGVFGYYPLGEMLIFHFGLLSINETTCEQAKPAVLKFVTDF